MGNMDVDDDNVDMNKFNIQMNEPAPQAKRKYEMRQDDVDEDII
jgi:hypothetical protein